MKQKRTPASTANQFLLNDLHINLGLATFGSLLCDNPVPIIEVPWLLSRAHALHSCTTSSYCPDSEEPIFEHHNQRLAGTNSLHSRHSHLPPLIGNPANSSETVTPVIRTARNLSGETKCNEVYHYVYVSHHIACQHNANLHVSVRN